MTNSKKATDKKVGDRKLYKVTFDKKNEPIDAKITPLYSGMGHGFGSWDPKTFFTFFVYVDAVDKQDAIKSARKIAQNRVENNQS
jgi:hypothetical protein